MDFLEVACHLSNLLLAQSSDRSSPPAFLRFWRHREAYLAFLPFTSFPEGFYGYVKKSELVKAIASKTTLPWAS